MWKRLGRMVWKISKILILPMVIEYAWGKFKLRNPDISETIEEVYEAINHGRIGL